MWKVIFLFMAIFHKVMKKIMGKSSIWWSKDATNPKKDKFVLGITPSFLRIYFSYFLLFRLFSRSFQGQRSGDHLFWIGARWGVGGGGVAVLSLWLFSTARLPNLLESGVMFINFINFKPLKSTFLLLSLIAKAGSTSKSLQIMILHLRFL